MGSRYPKAFGHRNDLYSAALLYFMCCITKHFSFLIFHSSEPSNVLKGQHVPWATPEPFTFSKKCDIL